ncbi:MAG: PEP-utilizing enzyme, partial [Patescibacteria group bacterium]
FLKKFLYQKKIVITNNLNVAFINKLAFLHRPRAIIITKGSVTSHAATVLREAKITTVYIRNISIDDDVKVKIDESGNIEVLES